MGSLLPQAWFRKASRGVSKIMADRRAMVYAAVIHDCLLPD